jgi:mono/diheme cytochrome c family protein
MATVAFVIGFIALGAAVAFIAFFGGPSGAREAYMTRGPRWFRVAIPIVYIMLGIAIPAVVIADHEQAKGSQGALRDEHASTTFDQGRELFREACWNCHTLKAAGAQGVTGPNLDESGPMPKARVLEAIEMGGTGSGRMPPHIYTGAEAEEVAEYVSEVAGR